MNRSFNEECINSLIRLYLVSDGKKEIRQDIETIVSIMFAKLISSKKRPFAAPPDEKCRGEVYLGKIVQGDTESVEFYVTLEDLQRHVAIFASTGSGKTTLIANIVEQLMNLPNPIHFLYFDFKEDLRHVKDQRIKVLRYDWLKLNPLKPPKNVDRYVWMADLADTFSHCFGFYSASENYLMSFLKVLYDLHGENGYPTLRELYETIATKSEKSMRYMEYQSVVKNRLESLLIVLGDVVDCEYGVAIEELLEYPLVFELDGLRRDEANFLVEFILMYIFAYRKANGHRGPLKHVLIFDEATRIYFKGTQYRETTIELGMPLIETIPQIIRDFSEGIVFALQEPSIVSHSVIANTNLKLVGFLGDGEDIETVADSLNLNDEEKSAITKLEKGEWLVKKSGMKPFMIRSPDYPFEKNVSDDELRQRMKAFLEKLKPKEKARTSEADVRQADLIQVRKDARALILDVNAHPFRGLVSRYKSLKLSGRKGDLAKQELLDKRLVEQAEVKLGRYRPVKFLVLTSLGIEYLNNSGIETELWASIGRVGFHHRLFQVLCAYSLKKIGYETHVERTVEGRRIDVLATKESKSLAIEIQLNSDLDVKKILEIQDRFDELFILCDNEEILDRLASMLHRAGCTKAKVLTVIQFLNNLIDNKHGNNPITQNKAEPEPDPSEKDGIKGKI